MDTQEPASTGESTGASATADVAPQSREERNYPDDLPKTEPPKQEAPRAKPTTGEQATDPSKETPKESPAAADDYQLQMPDGVELDRELLNSAVPMLKEAGISNDQANKLVPLVTQVQERLVQAQMDNFLVVRSDWTKQAKADIELGGKNWSETGRLARIALEAGGAGSPTHEARQLFEESGLGNHPAMLRLFRKMGAEIERLRRQAGYSRQGQAATREERNYPNDQPRR